jgi:hypothetical protein
MRIPRLFAVGGVAIAVILLALGYYWFVRAKVDSWTPTNPEPSAKVFFEAKWGFMGVGLYKASGKDEDVLNDGFKNFYINGNKVYIADTIKSEISVFEKNKLIRTYEYITDIRYDLGLAATDDFIYLLDDKGYISKINIQSGEYELHKRVIIEENSGVLAENSYTLYLLNDTIVAQGLFEKDHCFAAKDLSETPCPFSLKEDLSNKTQFVYLPQGYYAGVVAGADVWLYDSSDKKVGRVRGIDKVNLLYDAGKNYHIDVNGVYYAEHFEAKGFDPGVKIYFKPWQK